MDEHLQTLEHAKKTAIDLAIQFGPKLVVALLILGAGFYVGRWVGRITDSVLVKLGLDESLRQLLIRLIRGETSEPLIHLDSLQRVVPKALARNFQHCIETARRTIGQ